MNGNLLEAVERHQIDTSLRWCRIQGGDVYVDDELIVSIVGLPVSFTNHVRRARLGSENALRRVEATAALLRERGVPAIWWVGPNDTPVDLPALLARHGFRHEEDMPWMAADLTERPEIALPAGVEAFRVDGPERQVQWLEAMMKGFGMTEHEREAMTRLGEAVGFGEDTRWQRFVALERDRVVASSGLMLGPDDIGGVYNMATVPEHRGRGIGAAMATIAMGWARKAGCGLVVLGSSAKAVPLYERLGFRHVCRMAVYLFDPAG